MKYLLPILIFAVLLVACGAKPATGTPPPDSPVMSPNIIGIESPTGEPSDMPYSPRPNDMNLSRGSIFIEEMELLIRESYPPQIAIELSGNLPTPCHELRAVIREPDDENKINVDVYTVVDPNVMCTQVLKPFAQNIELGTFPSGHYSVWVNGAMIGEFDS